MWGPLLSPARVAHRGHGHLASKHPWQLSQIIYSRFTPKHCRGGNAFCLGGAYSKLPPVVLGGHGCGGEQRFVQPCGDLTLPWHVEPSRGCALIHTKTGTEVLRTLPATRRSKALGGSRCLCSSRKPRQVVERSPRMSQPLVALSVQHASSARSFKSFHYWMNCVHGALNRPFVLLLINCNDST